MTLFIRAAGEPDKLRKAAAKLIVPEDGPLPVEALREFTPSVRDDGWLSLFKIDSPAESLVVAAALGMGTRGLGEKPAFLFSASGAAIEALGLELKQTKGGCDHPEVDARHWSVKVSTDADLSAITRAFLADEIFFHEGRKIAAETRRAARANEFDFVKLASVGDGNPKAKYLLEFVKEKVALVTGVPVI